MLSFNFDWTKVEIEVDGEKITGEVRPLTVEEMIELSPVIVPAKEEPGLLFKQQKAVAPFVDKFIRNVEGVEVNGVPLDVKMLGTEASLAFVLMGFLTKALQSGKIDKESEKNLPSPSGEK